MVESLVEAYIGVGSNIRPAENIVAALAALRKRVAVTATSTFYRTAPLDGRDEEAYLNGVWRVVTSSPPRALKFDVLRRIEADLQRTRVEDRYAARTIDLDLLLFDDLVVNEEDLQLPDPDICERPFIALPLAELAPDLSIPGMDAPLVEYCRKWEESPMKSDLPFTEGLRESLRRPVS